MSGLERAHRLVAQLVTPAEIPQGGLETQPRYNTYLPYVIVLPTHLFQQHLKKLLE
jgi:hypothetical protein